MNQGFAVYYGGGLKAASATLYKNKNWLKYYAYLIMNLLARVTILPAVLFDLIAVRQARYVYDEKQLQLCASMRAAEKGKSLGTMLLVRVMQVLMLLAGTVIAAIVGGAVGLIGALVAWKANASSLAIWLFFWVPIGALCAITDLALILLFAPSAYIIEKNEGFGMAGVLEVSFDTMRQRGAFTHFMHHFVSLLIKGVFLGGIYALYRVSTAQQGAVAIALLAGAGVLAIVYLVVSPLFTLASRVADYCLLEDISLDPSNRAKHAKRVCLSRSVKNDRDYGHDKKLLALFDADGTVADTQVHEGIEEGAEAFESFARTGQETPPHETEAPPVEPATEERVSEPVEPEQAPPEEQAVEPTVEEAPPEKKAKGKRRGAKEEQQTTNDDTGDDL